MTSALTVRGMADGEEQQVVALWVSAGVARPWNDPLQDIAFARREPHSTLLVAERDGRIVATVMIGEDGHRGWAYYLAVDPEHQRGGLGREMMAAAEDWLRGRGVWKIQLLVREDNDAVRKFYETLGYVDTRTTCFQKKI